MTDSVGQGGPFGGAWVRAVCGAGIADGGTDGAYSLELWGKCAASVLARSSLVKGGAFELVILESSGEDGICLGLGVEGACGVGPVELLDEAVSWEVVGV